MGRPVSTVLDGAEVAEAPQPSQTSLFVTLSIERPYVYETRNDTPWLKRFSRRVATP